MNSKGTTHPLSEEQRAVVPLRGSFLPALAAILLFSSWAFAADEPRPTPVAEQAGSVVCSTSSEDGWIVAEGRTKDEARKLIWRVRLARAGGDAACTVRYDGPFVVVSSGEQRFVIDAQTGQFRSNPREVREHGLL